MLVGANDLGFTHLEETVTDIHGIVGALQSQHPNANIRVCEILPRKRWTRAVATSDNPNNLACELNHLLHKQFGDRVIPLYSRFLDQESDGIDESLYRDDGLHPNSRGGFVIKRCITHHLRHVPDLWPYHLDCLLQFRNEGETETHNSMPDTTSVPLTGTVNVSSAG